MHPNKHMLIFMLLTFNFSFYAQNYDVKGRISFHNSKMENKVIEYAKDVVISISSNNATTSDYKGRFHLKLDQSQIKVPINFSIEKTGYEVVNQKMLDHYSVDRKYLLRIFLAKKGYLESQQQELFYSNQKALFNHRDQLLDILAFDNKESKEEIKRLGEQLNIKLFNRLEAEERISFEVKNVEQKLKDFSIHLASVNLDFSSDMYKQAFGFYQNGNIEKTIQILDENTLEQSLNNIIAVIEKAKEIPEKLDKVMAIRIIQLNQIKESLVLKAIALHQVFRYQDAIPILQKISKIIEITKFGEDQEIYNLLEDKKLLSQKEVIPVVEKTEKIEELIEEIEVQIEDKIEIKQEAIVLNEEPTITINKEKKEVSQPTISTPENLLENEYETALLLKKKKRIEPETIATKGETLVETVEEVKIEKPIIIKKEPAKVVVKPTIIVESKPPPVTYAKEKDIVAKPPVKIIYSSFSITKKTSLRTRPTASSKVLKRLSVGTEVKLIKQIDKYWSKVILNGKTGYVKRLLLKKE